MQQLEGAEACRWYLFDVYRMSKVIIYQSKTIAVKWCQTSPLGDKKRYLLWKAMGECSPGEKNYYGKGNGVSVHQEKL